LSNTSVSFGQIVASKMVVISLCYEFLFGQTQACLLCLTKYMQIFCLYDLSDKLLLGHMINILHLIDDKSCIL